MTSREALATAVTAAPALAVALILLAPRRFVAPVAQLAAFPVAALAATLAVQALRSPGAPVVGDWLVVDVAGGLLVGVIGVVGLASVLVSQSYLDHARTSLVSPERGDRVYYAVLYAFWAISARGAAGRQPRRGVAPRRGDDRGLGAARRLQRHGAGAGGGLEVPRPHLARARRGAARDRPHRGRCAGGRARRALVAGALGPCELGRRPRRLPAPARRDGRQDRLGARAQLAAGCALRGAAAGLGAPVRRAPASGAARRLAVRAGPRAGDRRAHGGERPRRRSGSPRSRWRSPSSGGRCPGSGCSPTRASSTWA